MTHTFKSLGVFGWRQYSRVQIQFDRRLTIITGENGAGKSGLINLLTQHMGQVRQYAAVPIRQPNGVVSYFSGVQSAFTSILGRVRNFLASGQEGSAEVGFIEYSNDQKAKLSVPTKTSHAFNLSINNQQSVHGVAVPSHRSLSTISQISQISIDGIEPSSAYSRLFGEVNNRFLGQGGGNGSMFHLKEALVSWAFAGEDTTLRQADPRQMAAFNGFQEVLRIVLPSKLGFSKVGFRGRDVVLETRSGDFVLDAVSGGISAIIETAALIYFFSLSDGGKREFTVVMDEPENHLHPALQRELLLSLLKAFPSARFVVATHSPFVVTSEPNSRVYVLRYHDEVDSEGEVMRRVSSVELDQANKAGSASDVLREVLGVPVTMPIWAEKKIEEIVAEALNRNIDEQMLAELKIKLSSIGFADYFPEALSRLAKRIQ